MKYLWPLTIAWGTALSLFAIDPCPADGSLKPVALEVPLVVNGSESDTLLNAILPGPQDIVEARWDQSGRLSCMGLVVGRSSDLRLVASQLASVPRTDGMDARYAVVTMPRKRLAEEPILAAVQSPTRACNVSDDWIEAAKRGIVHFRASGNRTRLAADCFKQAATSRPDSLLANLGVALSLAILGDHASSTEFYEKVSNLEPLMLEDNRLATARFVMQGGDWKEAIKRLEDLANGRLSLSTKDLLYRALKAAAEGAGDPAVAANAQENLVRTLTRIRELAPGAVNIQSWSLENLDLGARLESFDKLGQAKNAYESAFQSALSNRSQFEPDLGRIRIARKQHAPDGEVRKRCDNWTKQVSSSAFKIDFRDSGGLDMALARIDYSCGNEARASNRIARWMSKRPSWDEPYWLLGEMLQSQSKPQEAARVFQLARRIKLELDNRVLYRIAEEATAILRTR